MGLYYWILFTLLTVGNKIISPKFDETNLGICHVKNWIFLAGPFWWSLRMFGNTQLENRCLSALLCSIWKISFLTHPPYMGQ
jgi:hypothetical protein